MIPNNDEHQEAEILAKMSPEAAARFEIVKQAADLIESAKVPYVMFTQLDSQTSHLFRAGQMRYGDTMNDAIQGAAFWTLTTNGMLEWITERKGVHIDINVNGQQLGGYENGKGLPVQ